MENVPAIEVEDVWLKRNEEVVLEAINLRVMPGDFYAILGPNGGGKTTLLKVILGLTPQERGSVRILGEAPHKNRHLIGYIPQRRTFDFEYPSAFGTWSFPVCLAERVAF
jgi:zinc transport system ATP-binding protein